MSTPQYEDETQASEAQAPAAGKAPDAAYTRGLLAWLINRAEFSPAERQQARVMLDQAYPPSQADLDAAKPPQAPQTTGATGDYFVPAGYQLVPSDTTEGGSQ